MKKILSALFLIATITFTGCVDKKPLTEQQKAFAGRWVTNDGTWLHVFNDGGGSFQQSNKSVTGGAAEISDTTIVIGLMGIESTYRIDKAPYEENGVWMMQLDGNTYVKR